MRKTRWKHVASDLFLPDLHLPRLCSACASWLHLRLHLHFVCFHVSRGKKKNNPTTFWCWLFLAGSCLKSAHPLIRPLPARGFKLASHLPPRRVLQIWDQPLAFISAHILPSKRWTSLLETKKNSKLFEVRLTGSTSDSRSRRRFTLKQTQQLLVWRERPDLTNLPRMPRRLSK